MELILGLSILSLSVLAGREMLLDDSSSEEPLEDPNEERDFGYYTIEGAFGPTKIKFDPFADDRDEELVAIKEKHVANHETTLATVFDTNGDSSIIYIDDTMSGLKLPSNFDPKTQLDILNDTIFGGEGDDLLIGHYGDNTIFGGAGDDELSVRIWDGDSEVYAGAGQDQIEARRVVPEFSPYYHHIYGEDHQSDDELGGRLILDVGSGDDTIFIGSLGFDIQLGDGADQTHIHLRAETLQKDSNRSEASVISDFDPSQGDFLSISVETDEDNPLPLPDEQTPEDRYEILRRELAWDSTYLSEEFTFHEDGNAVIISINGHEAVKLENQSLENLQPYLDDAQNRTDGNHSGDSPVIQFRYR